MKNKNTTTKILEEAARKPGMAKAWLDFLAKPQKPKSGAYLFLESLDPKAIAAHVIDVKSTSGLGTFIKSLKLNGEDGEEVSVRADVLRLTLIELFSDHAKKDPSEKAYAKALTTLEKGADKEKDPVAVMKQKLTETEALLKSARTELEAALEKNKSLEELLALAEAAAMEKTPAPVIAADPVVGVEAEPEKVKAVGDDFDNLFDAQEPQKPAGRLMASSGVAKPNPPPVKLAEVETRAS